MNTIIRVGLVVTVLFGSTSAFGAQEVNILIGE